MRVFKMLAATVLFGSVGTVAYAQDAPISQHTVTESVSSDTPYPLVYLQHNKVALTYLGHEGGAEAYFGVLSGDKTQVFYLSQDKTMMIPGMLFSVAQGDMADITSSQIRNMQERSKGLSVSGIDISHESKPLEYLTSHGVTLTPLPSYGGNEAYLGEARDGKMQVFYVTPDKTGVIAGVLFGFKEGSLIDETGIQLKQMKADIALQRQRVLDASKQKTESLDETSKSADRAQEQIHSNVQSLVTTGTPALPPVSLSPLLSGLKSPSGSVDMERYVDKTTTKAEFEDSVKNTAWFSVGRPDAPVLYIVADPLCPHCHKVWGLIKNRVLAGQLTVHVILIAGLPGAAEPATQLLSKSKPGQAWIEGEGSTDSIAVTNTAAQGSDAYKHGQAYVQINNNFASDNHVTGTPWMVYVGKDGRVYRDSGDQDIEQFLGAL